MKRKPQLELIMPPSGGVRHWVVKIAAAWQKSVASILETGQLLIDAKDDLEHGAFTTMVQLELPFNARTAQRLMAIAEHPVLSKATHASLLPPSWMTLYELTRLDDETLIARIEDGTINPKMERRDVDEMRGKRRPRKGRKRSAVDPIDRAMMTVRQVVLTCLRELPQERWDQLLSELAEEVSDINQIAAKRRGGTT